MDVIVFDGEEEFLCHKSQLENEIPLNQIAELYKNSAIYLASAKKMLSQSHSMLFALIIFKVEMGLVILAKRLEKELGTDLAIYFMAHIDLIITLEHYSNEVLISSN